MRQNIEAFAQHGFRSHTQQKHCGKPIRISKGFRGDLGLPLPTVQRLCIEPRTQNGSFRIGIFLVRNAKTNGADIPDPAPSPRDDMDLFQSHKEVPTLLIEKETTTLPTELAGCNFKLTFTKVRLATADQ
jgi:hypothetical protein